jgi:hypothetical protein
MVAHGKWKFASLNCQQETQRIMKLAKNHNFLTMSKLVSLFNLEKEKEGRK